MALWQLLGLDRRAPEMGGAFAEALPTRRKTMAFVPMKGSSDVTDSFRSATGDEVGN